MNGNRGYSLLEVMMVVAIMGAFSAMGTAMFFNRSQARMLYQSEVDKMQVILSTARNTAMSLGQCTQVTRTNARTITVDSYALSSPCALALPPPAPVSTVTQTFNQATTISDFSTGSKMMFKPGGGTTQATPVTIDLTNSQNRTTFTIYPAIGQIRHL